MSKIKKLDVENFGSYKSYIWNSSISPDFQFKDVNIIYGRNYSGKTTLSRLFKCIEDNSLHNDYENPQFSFTLNSDEIISNDSIYLNDTDICVYNTDFVKKNLNWLHNEDGSIEPFTVLGGDNNEIETQISEITNILGDNPKEIKEEYNKGLLFDFDLAENKFQTSFKLHKRLSDELENKLRNKANQEIKKNTLYQNVNYTIRNIQNDIKKVQNDKIKALADETIEKNKSLIKEDIKQDIKTLAEQKPNFEKYFLEVKELISKKIKPSKPIQDLLNDNLLQEWVRKGRDHHENKRETCAFCGNPISEDLWEKLDEHFSKESEELRNKIKSKIADLENKKNALDSFILFSEKDFYSTSQENIKKLLEDWKILKDTYKKNIEELISQLKKRLEDIFNDVELENINDISDDILELIQKINSLIAINNSTSLTHEKNKKNARIELRLSEIAKFLKDIDYEKKIKAIDEAEIDKESKEKDKNELGTVIREQKENIRQLQTQLRDETKGAELVNEYLERFFGFNGFKLVALDEDSGVKYKILRNGLEAKNLSEGECSLISFCYFIGKIKDKLDDEVSQNNLILYIDDPISSLDSNHIYFIFSLIEHIITKPKKYKQLFISTHNLDFLKYIKRLTVSKDELMYFLIEMEQKQNDKRSKLTIMPKHLEKYTTEFNYLFNEIYKLYKEVRGDRARQIENSYNQFYNIPNNIRKFLEYYLFYKYPNSDSPLDNLDKLFDNEIPSRINRIVNELSHLTFIDRGWNPLDVPEIEECTKIVIEKIKEKDPEQFDALVESVS